jgi:hypothetical protein
VGNPPENFKKGSVPIGNPAAVLPVEVLLRLRKIRAS